MNIATLSAPLKLLLALCVVISTLATSATGSAPLYDSDLESTTTMTVPRSSRGGTRGGASVRGTSDGQRQRQLDGVVIKTKDVPNFVEGAGKDDMMAVVESQMEHSDASNSSAKSSESSKSTRDPKVSSTKSQKFKSMKDPSGKSSSSSKKGSKSEKSKQSGKSKKSKKSKQSKKSKKSRKGLLSPKKRSSPKTQGGMLAIPAASAAGTSTVHKKADSTPKSTILTTEEEEETTTQDGGSFELLQDTLDDTTPETYGSYGSK